MLSLFINKQAFNRQEKNWIRLLLVCFLYKLVFSSFPSSSLLMVEATFNSLLRLTICHSQYSYSYWYILFDIVCCCFFFNSLTNCYYWNNLYTYIHVYSMNYRREYDKLLFPFLHMYGTETQIFHIKNIPV